VLANIYLHYVMDLWFEKRIRKQCKGAAYMVRYTGDYCYAPVLLETFVDTSHFAGTCYKASNWIYLGETQGRGRMDREKDYGLSRKAIYMYPLQKDFKDCLKGLKPCKTVNPDD
jgi:hypothetical protein